MTKYTILTVCGLILVGSLLLNILFREVDFLKDVKLIKEVNANSIINLETLDVDQSRFNSSLIQGCSKVAYHDDISYIAYMQENIIDDTAEYDIYIRKYNHDNEILSEPYFVGTELKDHTYPCIAIDSDNYLHVFFGARPFPIKHMTSINPLDLSAWSSEEIGFSATYIVANFNDADDIMLMYREGGSPAASLDLAVYNGTDWNIQKIIGLSDKFIPMPLDYFRQDNRTCFLFNMRDKYGSMDIYGDLADIIRESLSVVCTEDGSVITDLEGNVLNTPLDYANDYYNFPIVVKEKELHHVDTTTRVEEGIDEYSFSDLNQDGTVVEFEFTKQDYSRSKIDIKDNGQIVNNVYFLENGKIAFSKGNQIIEYGEYTPGVASRIRMKYYFSYENNHFYRVWVDGKLDYQTYAFWQPGVAFYPLDDYYLIPTSQTLSFDIEVYSFEPRPMSFRTSGLPWGAYIIHYAVVDINKDEILDMNDFSIFAQAYNSFVTDDNYNNDCDFNNDEYVNSFDFEFFKKVYLAGTGSIYENPYYRKVYFEWTPWSQQIGSHVGTIYVDSAPYYDSALIKVIALYNPVASAVEEEPFEFTPSAVTGITKIEVKGSNLEYSFKINKDYKMRTGAMCLDKDNDVNIFFADKQDTADSIKWPLVHYRNGVIKEISELGVDTERPSCIADEDGLYTLVQYFDHQDDLFHQLRLLRTEDYNSWNDMMVDESDHPLNNPTFSKIDGTGYKRFVWTDGDIYFDPISPELATFKYGYFKSIVPVKYKPPIKFKKDF